MTMPPESTRLDAPALTPASFDAAAQSEAVDGGSAADVTAGDAAPAMAATAALGAAQADLDAVEAIVKQAGTSFYQGMRVLPPDRRHAMYAIYGFCRIVDDIADEGGSLPEKLAGLQAWRQRILDLYRGASDGPVTRVLVLAVRRFDLRADDFIAVIDGMQMDCETAIVAPDMATLERYCDRVASAVGRLSVRAFGDASPAADRVAQALGRALQLTNILRDIQEDAERGRLYLPRDYLDPAGVPHDPAAALQAAGLPQACARLAERAQGYFRIAQAEMRQCDRRAMRPARLMGATYAAILSRLQRSGWRRLDARVGLPLWQKLWLVCRYGLL
jgi:phytoene synthase